MVRGTSNPIPHSSFTMPHTPKHHQFLHILFTSFIRLNVHDAAYIETVYCMKRQNYINNYIIIYQSKSHVNSHNSPVSYFLLHRMIQKAVKMKVSACASLRLQRENKTSGLTSMTYHTNLCKCPSKCIRKHKNYI